MTYGKRGMQLENMIEYTNKIYKQKGLALIDKVPTPWNVSYDRRTGKVFRAFPERKGTVDFVGISNGNSIAFEAKSTDIETRIPLSNFHKHQIQYLVNHKEQGGLSFTIVHFNKRNKTYLLSANDLVKWWNNQFKKGGRKSIPYRWFAANAVRIRSGNGVPLDYLNSLKRSVW